VQQALWTITRSSLRGREISQRPALAVGEAENASRLWPAGESGPDVILLDVEMPVMGAEEAIRQLSRVSLSKAVVLTMYDEPRWSALLSLSSRLCGQKCH